ncbi:hypothetical protein FHU10_4362 [Serratia fonticola]|jgi:hypothetical protein|uniref:Uncharacterized protein n=1 Tax=Serratia fonticola TaxID=47917 RepID=A0A542BQ99_SERFO|nr:hypothetical protein FHU09_3341 [Serratia fonticola]TQI97225.1 hypothetical protein FHU11_2703 [Serratia fonticola]TVZ71721.1 hypothetical protein FHU10_4362 [Serratia fonticola]
MFWAYGAINNPPVSSIGRNARGNSPQEKENLQGDAVSPCFGYLLRLQLDQGLGNELLL